MRAGGGDMAMAEAGNAPGPRLSRAQAATLDVLVAELLTERRAADAPHAVADVLARMARANLAFPEAAVVQARAPPRVHARVFCGPIEVLRDRNESVSHHCWQLRQAALGFGVS